MQKEISFTLDSTMARHLAWRLAFDPRVWGAFLAIFAFFIIFELTRNGESRPGIQIVPFICLPFIIFLVSVMVNYRMLCRTGADAGPIRLVVDEDGLLTQNSRTSAKLVWTQVARLRWTPLLLLVYQTKTVFFPVPRQKLDAETEQFLADKVRAAGGRIS